MTLKFATDFNNVFGKYTKIGTKTKEKLKLQSICKTRNYFNISRDKKVEKIDEKCGMFGIY
jgi:hypothetical protein